MADTGGKPVHANKTETAELVAQWATHELGFRKPSTLVTTKGEDKLTPADVEPLLQGELANILELLATHVVSSQKAARIRTMLASYSAQATPSSGSKDQPVSYIALQKTLKDIHEREKAALSEIRAAELESANSIKEIDSLATKKSAVESRIRELRLRILLKQAMAEKVGRLSRRMSVLIRETKVATGGSKASTETGPLLDLLRSIEDKTLADDSDISIMSGNPALEDGSREQSQVMVANLITDLKTRDSVGALKSEVSAAKSELAVKLEALSGKLNTETALGGGDARDYKEAVLQSVINDAVAQVRGRVNSLVPQLVPARAHSWNSGSHNDKIALVATQVKHLRRLLSATQTVAAETRSFAVDELLPAYGHLQTSLRYTDTREAWNSADFWSLQRVAIDSSGETEPERKRIVGDIIRAATGSSGQTHEAAATELVDQLVQGESANTDALNGNETLETAAEALYQKSAEEREAARGETDKWKSQSNVETSLTIANESANVEDLIVQLSDASGRLFTDSFAPWHERDGISYSEYLKQLKIAQASDQTC
ncbi:hypothetical protein LPJ53_000152 [Coemansia erecta]|uniref:Uncharacterized protein n=1 Tax=Coemansia erecta TaxID=147472 RepID=A0A9W7Y7L5_9FUNG|nr:hypothetical protein LPJ53_000152 [Coemansia erecta]